MANKRKNSKTKTVNRQLKSKPSSNKATTKMQGAAKCAFWPTAVPLLLQLLTIAAMGMLLVVSFHSLPVNTKATAVKNNVWEQLPSMTMTQSLSLALATAAVSAVLAERLWGSRHTKTSTSLHCGLLWQALVMMSKMVLYSGFSLLLAFHILAVAKSNCIWQAQAVLHNQASSLLPDVVKSQGFGLSVTCVGFAALMLESFLETSHPGEDKEQCTNGMWKACMYLMKSVLYGCAAYSFLTMAFALRDAGSHWASEGGLGDYMASLGLNISVGPLLAVFMTLAGMSALMIEGYFVKTKRKLDCVGAAEDMAANAAVSTPISTPPEPHHAKVPHAAINGQSRKHAGKLAKNAGSTIGSDEGLDTIKAGYMTTSDKRIGAGSGETDVNTMQKVDVDGQSGQAAAGVITDALSKTSNPSTDALTEVKKKSRKGRRQRASNKKLTGEKASAAAPVKNTSSTDMQEAAPAFTNTGSDIKRGKKKDRATLTSTPLQHNPPAETAVDWDDVYCALVRAILKGAAGGPSAAQLEIAVCMAGLFRAVPAWMLKFGTITNKDYSALAGLQTFQSLLTGKLTTTDLLSVLDELTKTKSMALLLRTLVAAYVQKELENSGCKDESDGRLMAQDILRMSLDADMPQYMQAVPQWHLTALRQVMTTAL